MTTPCRRSSLAAAAAVCRSRLWLSPRRDDGAGDLVRPGLRRDVGYLRQLPLDLGRGDSRSLYGRGESGAVAGSFVVVVGVASVCALAFVFIDEPGH